MYHNEERIAFDLENSNFMLEYYLDTFGGE